MLIGWCELRENFRSFRTDRVTHAEFVDERHGQRPAILRARWLKTMAERRARWSERPEMG